ncbi:MAG TPA: ABC transporter transmembrane domain-containing protein [Chitinophagales bacterium]|nr:ABC transporter transmembrane domain-containing protein [Chitinophagales bacterium]
MQKNMSPIGRFLELISLERKEIISIYFYAIVSGVIYLSLPLGIQSIINLLFGGLISTSVIVLIFIVVFGVALNGWLQIMQMRVNERIQRRIFTRYSLEFAHKIPRLDLMAVDDYYLPELVNRFFDTASLQKGLSKVLLDFPSASIQIIFGLTLLSFYSPIFILFGILLITMVMLILRFTYPRGMSTSLEESNYKYEVGYWLEEVARTIKTIKFMGMIDFPARRADQLVSGYLDARANHFKILQIQYWAFVAFKIIITASLLVVGCYLVIDQQINLGQFIASEIVIITLLNSVEKIIGSLDVVYDMLTSLEKVSKVLDKPEERADGILLSDSGNENGISIKAQNLSYRFSNQEKYVLNGLNFEIAPGEKVCIFGTEGSGKSTLLKLFTGAYPTFQGNLLFNDIPLGNFNLNELRKEIGVYLITADLFSGTLADNLTLGDEKIDTQLILKTAEDTGLLHFIQSQKNGLATRIDSIGKKLPRNTVNKILLTRALLTEPKLLLLEDCWSGLEKHEQEKMITYLTAKQCSFTLISVTNDPVFASQCDKVILLDEGKIVSYGTFTEVSDMDCYKNMFKKLSL